MNHGTKRDIAQRKGVARLNVRTFSRHDGVTHRQPDRGKNVTLLAIRIMKQREIGGAIRIIFKRGNLSGNAVLFAAKIDDAIATFVSAATIAAGNAPAIISPTTFMVWGKK